MPSSIIPSTTTALASQILGSTLHTPRDRDYPLFDTDTPLRVRLAEGPCFRAGCVVVLDVRRGSEVGCGRRGWGFGGSGGETSAVGVSVVRVDASRVDALSAVVARGSDEVGVAYRRGAALGSNCKKLYGGVAYAGM